MSIIRWVDYQGETMPLKHAAERAGISYSAMYNRVVGKGMSPEKAEADIKGAVKRYGINGRMMSTYEMAKVSGVPYTTLKERLLRGEAPERAMMTAEQRGTRKCRERKEIKRCSWPEKAFNMLYPADEMERMGFREKSADNWVWRTEFFLYMASRLGRDHMLLRAWWRDSGEPAMLRLYRLHEVKTGDVLEEIADPAMRRRILKRWRLDE